MLRIREEQVGCLSPVARRSLAERILGHARMALGPGALPGPAAEDLSRIEALMDEALGMGLSWETHVAAFAALRLGLGEAALTQLGYAHRPQAPKAEIAAAFDDFLAGLPDPWHGICRFG